MAKAFSGKKPQHFGNTIRVFLNYLGRHKFMLGLVGVLTAVSALANLLGTYMIKPVVNGILETGSIPGLVRGVALTAAIYAVGALSTLGYTQTMVRAAQKVLHDIRRDLFAHLQTLPLSFFDSRRNGELMSLFESAAHSRLVVYNDTLDDPEGWLERIDADLARYWEAGILRPALLRLPEGSRIQLIPAGQALAALVRTIEAEGGVGNVTDRRDLFSDQIHLNDLGNYFIALVHYAVLYGSSPEGLPHELKRADGTAADAPAPETARLMQQIAWQVARSTPLTGLAP